MYEEERRRWRGAQHDKKQKQKVEERNWRLRTGDLESLSHKRQQTKEGEHYQDHSRGSTLREKRTASEWMDEGRDRAEN